MVNITTIGNSIVFKIDGKEYSFPKLSLFTSTDDNSDFVNIRSKASRRKILSFSYRLIDSFTANNAKEAQLMISDMLNN